MSKINNVRLPNAAQLTYDPQQVDQLIRSLEQVIFQLNTTYTPVISEDKVSELDWFTGAMGMANRGVLEDYGDFAYGSFVDFENQTVDDVNTATAIKFGTTAYAKHISVVNDGEGDPTKITFAKAGKYYVHFTAELHSESANDKAFFFWPRINGVDLTGSTMMTTLHNNDSRLVVSRAGIFEVDKGDYLQAMWATDNTDADLHGATLADLDSELGITCCPAVPSVTLMIHGIEHG